jgi:tetratricopeptide (TPR) repeat protein
MRHVSLLLIAAGLVSAQESAPSWADKTILVKRPGVKIFAEPGDEKSLADVNGIDYRVRAEKDGYLEISTNTVPRGWIRKRDTVLIDEAVDYFTDVIGREPNNADAYACRAVAYRWKHELAKAVKDLDEAIRLDPKSAAWLSNRAQMRTEQKDPDGAIRDFDTALEIVPKNGAAFLGRANAFYVKQDYEKAIRDYDAAIALDSKFVLPIFYRGNAWYQKREFEQAIRDYEEVLKRDPRFEVAYHNRGNVYFAKKEFTKAIADYTETIKLLPTYAPSYNLRGASEYYLKDYVAARKDYEKAIELDPNYASAWYGLAWLLAVCPDAKIRNGEKALECLRAGNDLAKTRTPKLAEIAAAVHAELGNFDRALRFQQEAVEDAHYVRLYGDVVRQRLELYRKQQPYRDQ